MYLLETGQKQYIQKEHVVFENLFPCLVLMAW